MKQIKKQILIAILCVAVGAAMIGGGTFAYFNSTATSAGNTFAAGTIDIAKAGNVSGQFNVADKKPGDSFGGTFNIKNTGSLDANLTAKFTYSTSGQAVDIATQLVIDNLQYSDDGNNWTNVKPSDVTTLAQLQGKVLNLGQLSHSMTTTRQFKLLAHFLYTETDQNAYQGASLSGVFDFEAKQLNP